MQRIQKNNSNLFQGITMKSLLTCSILMSCFSFFTPIHAQNVTKNMCPKLSREEVVVSDTISYTIEKSVNLLTPKGRNTPCQRKHCNKNLQNKNARSLAPILKKGASQFQEYGVTLQTATKIVHRSLLQTNVVYTASVPTENNENGDIKIDVTFFTDVPTRRVKQLARRFTKRIKREVENHAQVKYGQLTHIINKTVYHKDLVFIITLPYDN